MKNMYPAPYTGYDYNYENNVKNPIECILYTHQNKYGSLTHLTRTPQLTNQGLHILVCGTPTNQC